MVNNNYLNFLFERRDSTVLTLAGLEADPGTTASTYTLELVYSYGRNMINIDLMSASKEFL